MREIKFRFYAKDTKRMISWEEACKIGLRKNDFTEDDNWCPLQFTGLLDKNGKEIYEGDIVKANGDSEKVIFEVAGENGLIEWDDNKTRFIVNYKKSEFKTALLKDDTGLIRVIGNIFKNPDLLTSHKD